MMDPRRSWKERNKYYLSLKSSFLQLQTYVNDTSMSTVNCNKSGIPVARWFKFQWYWWIFHGHVHGNGWQIPNTTKHNKRNKDAQNQWSYHPGISTTSSALKKNASLCSRLDRHLNLWKRDSCSPGKWNMAVSLQNRMSMADSRYL